MRGSGFWVLALWAALACGGEQPAPPGGAGAAPAPPAPKGPVLEVRMIGDGRRIAAFEPAAITITPGTVVRFVNVSGGPHNVAFWPDSIPPGAAAPLDAAMPGRMTRLAGPMLTQPNATYAVPFPADAPPGRYPAYCLPHLAMGMTITITVR